MLYFSIATDCVLISKSGNDSNDFVKCLINNDWLCYTVFFVVITKYLFAVDFLFLRYFKFYLLP